jgi:hypothetical protein
VNLGSRRAAGRDEDGAVLLLVLFFVVGIGLSVAALVALSGTNLIATFHLQGERNLEYAADAAADGAVQFARSPTAYSVSCQFPSNGSIAVDQNNLVVECLPGSGPSGRMVQFAVCRAPTTDFSACNANAVLVAEVQYGDTNCTPGTDQCFQYGTSITIRSWLVKRANGG